MRGRLEPKDTVERFWGLKFIGFPNLSDETPKPFKWGEYKTRLDQKTNHALYILGT